MQQLNKRFNYLLIIHFISNVLLIESFFVLLAVGTSIVYNDGVTSRMVVAFLLMFCVGALMFLLTRRREKSEPSKQESLIIVSIGWFVMALFGTVPYILTQSIPYFCNAFFESMSGFTTTGSSILVDIEVLPKSILFWRSETHWIGGMGIIVLLVAILPFIIKNGMYLFNSEMSHVVEEKTLVKIKYVARRIWLIYIGLTVVETLLLWFSGMELFDSVCHSFATVATGGFSTKNDSITGYSPLIQYIIMVFMVLSGMNFALHILSLKGNLKRVLKNEELRFYFLIIFVIATLIAISLIIYDSFPVEKAFRDSFFQVISVITATGFATADYLLWPLHTILLIVFLMLIGASAGSTGGGIKVIRNLIALKKIKNSLHRIINPNSITPIKYNNKVISTDQVSGVLTFIFMYYMIIVAGTFIMNLIGTDSATSLGAVITTMGGIGPGFGKVGPAANFSEIPEAGKYFLTFTMVIGRLEIYPVLIIFTRWFWKNA